MPQCPTCPLARPCRPGQCRWEKEMPKSLIVEYLQAEVRMARQLQRTEVNGYVSQHDYVLQNGRQYESAQVSPQELESLLKLNMREFKLKECYYNSQFVAISFPEFTYVEGMAVPEQVGLPIDHAWLELNGKVVDVTWRPWVCGVIPKGCEYYGVPLTRKQVWANVRAHGTWQPVIDDFQCRWPVLRGGRHLSKREIWSRESWPREV